MTPNDHLFQLIKSLTASEKRYFKLFAAKHAEGGKSNYEKLFDAFNELPDNSAYNEKEFLQQLKAKKLGKYLSDEKKYLTELVMKAMRHYSAEKKADGRLVDMIQEMNFLIEKGLFDQCTKIAEKAWAIAEERELTDQKIKLLHIKREIDKQDYGPAREAYQKELRSQEETAIAQLKTEREAAYLREQLYGIYITTQMAQQAVEVEKIYHALDKLHQQPNLTFNCTHNIISAKCIVYNRKEYKKAIELLKYMIGRWEKKPARIEEMPDRYVKLVSHLMVFVFRIEDYKEIPAIIEKLNSVKTTEKDVLKDIFFLSTTAKLFNYINNTKYNLALQMVPEMKAGLKTFDALLSFIQKRVLSSNICLIYLKNKKYADVLDAVQEVYTLVGRSKEKQLKLEDIKVFEFIAHYESGNVEPLHYTVRNNQRYFKDHQPDNLFIENLWKVIKQFIQDSSKPKVAKQLLKEQVQALDCPPSNIALKQEIVAWLEA